MFFLTIAAKMNSRIRIIDVQVLLAASVVFLFVLPAGFLRGDSAHI